MKHYLYIGTLAISICLACNSPEKTEAETVVLNGNKVSLTMEQQKNIHLQVGEIENGEATETLKLQGKIDVPPQNLISVSIPLGGYLKSIKMLPGTPVRKGQLIAVL